MRFGPREERDASRRTRAIASAARRAPRPVRSVVWRRSRGHPPADGTPRMPFMPATMNKARFVGREAAFVRLAPALEAASDGVATTVLLEGLGGVGVSRFVSELCRRVPGLYDYFS